MAFAHISYLAMLAAALASFAFGALWYGLLGRQWLAALGSGAVDVAAMAKPPVWPMVTSFIAELIMAIVLAGVIGHLGPGAVSVKNGVISGAFIWAGFVVTTLVVNNAYAGRKLMLSVLDAGHWLGVLLVQGAVLGAIG